MDKIGRAFKCGGKVQQDKVTVQVTNIKIKFYNVCQASSKFHSKVKHIFFAAGKA